MTKTLLVPIEMTEQMLPVLVNVFFLSLVESKTASIEAYICRGKPFELLIIAQLGDELINACHAESTSGDDNETIRYRAMSASEAIDTLSRMHRRSVTKVDIVTSKEELWKVMRDA